MTPAEVTEFRKSNDIGITDLGFTDLPGTLQHRYEMSAADLAMIRQVPGLPDGVLAALEGGDEFLMREGVLTDDLVDLAGLQGQRRGRPAHATASHRVLQAL